MPGDTARFNGKKGGRPKGSKASHTLAAEKAREILIMKLVAEIGPVADALIEKAKAGDIQAIKEAFERAFGKSAQPIAATDSKGNVVPISAINVVPIS